MPPVTDEPKPPTEEEWPPPTTSELAEWESLSRAPDSDDYEERYAKDYPEASSEAIERLVAEVRRLRSDEWLRAAVEAYYGTHADAEIAEQRERLLERLRKHRDGTP